MDNMFIFMPASQCLDYCSFVVRFKISKYESSDFVFMFQDYFGYLETFEISYKFEMSFSISAKNTIEISLGL